MAGQQDVGPDGFERVEDEDTDTYVGFKCLDPDRHVIEVSWET